MKQKIQMVQFSTLRFTFARQVKISRNNTILIKFSSNNFRLHVRWLNLHSRKLSFLQFKKNLNILFKASLSLKSDQSF